MFKQDRNLHLELIKEKVSKFKVVLEHERNCKEDKKMLKAMNVLLSVISLLRED